MPQVNLDVIKAALREQESQDGRHPKTYQLNNHKAFGKYQIIEKTFNGMKANGSIPADWVHTNPEHADKAGELLVEQLHEQYAGDPTKIAAAFYAGPKAVRSDGSIKNYTDKKNPGNPDTLKYIQQVTARLGNDVRTDDTTRSGAEYLMNARMPVATEPVAPAAAPAAVPQASGLPGNIAPVDFAAGNAAQRAPQTARKEVIDNTSFGDTYDAASVWGGLTGAVARTVLDMAHAPDYKPDPNFKRNPAMYEDRTAEEQEELFAATSAQQEVYIRAMQDHRRAGEDEMSRAGMAQGLAAGFVADLPANLATGLIAARALSVAGLGSMALAAQGRTGAAVASQVAEGVGAGVLTTGLQEAIDGHVSMDDLATGALFDLGTSMLGIPGTVSVSRSYRAAATEAATRRAELVARAQAAVGEGAPVQAVVAEARRLEEAPVREVLAEAQRISADRRLLSEEDNNAVIYGQVPEGANPEGGAGGTQPQPAAYSEADANLEARTKLAQESADKSVTMAQIGQQGDDVRVTSYVPDTAPQHVKDAANATLDLAATYLPDHVRVGVAYMPGQSVAGMAEADGPVVRVSFSDIGTSSNEGMQIAVHEVTHAMNAYYLPNYVNKADLLRDYGDFVATVKAGDLEKAARMRWASKEKPQVDPNSRYDLSFDEWVAEQSAKYANEQAGAGKDVGLRAELAAKLRDWADRILGLFFQGKDKKYIPAAESVKQYVDAVRAREVQPVKFARPVKAQADSGAQASLMNDPIASKYGVDLLPQGDPIESAKAKAILALYKKADGYAKPDEKRLNTLLKNTPFGSTATKMLVSENPIIRMVASELLESATGATKRQATAAIGKYLAERRMLGNSLNQYELLYSDWSRERGGNVLKDTFDGQHWADFNREVALYIEGAQANAHPAVKAAAEALEKSYDRIRTEQVQARTLGYQGLPATSKGYMPRRMSPAALRNMTVEQQRVLHSALTDQFIQNEGFDPTFADTLASRYIETIRKRGVGGHTSSVGEGSADLDIMDAAIDGMNLNAKEAFVLKGKLRAGAAGHTKGRLKLDLVREHTLADGSTFRLLDVFETDQRQLLRQQAARASGEVALAQHGILGKPGLDLLREAASLGDTGQRAQPAELEAFDQVAAEFLAAPFGTNQNRNLERVAQATTLSRLGGMAFPQMSEYLNGIAHVGVEATLGAVSGMVRLRNEAKALARGEKVDNPLLSSIETIGGAEFGTDNYKFSFPYENPDNVYQTFGKDSVTAVDRMLRGGMHLQSKLSFWRALHAAQERGMAEQVVRKALRYMREGGNDAALSDMGFSADLGTRLGLDSIATWEGGRVVSLDLTKAQDVLAAEEFIQAVHRGTKQIIQGTFIGEQGKWVHDGFLKFLGQFRTFSINATEKQWTRQMNNHGTYKGLGFLLGTMAMAAPIYVARVYVNSVGRDDREEYLDKMLAPGMMARATLNYVAMSGLAGDFVDAFTAVTGTGELTGARTGAASGFVGTVLAPGAGWIDDVWRAAQNTDEGTNLEPLAKTLPFANLPYLSLGIRSLVE